MSCEIMYNLFLQYFEQKRVEYQADYNKNYVAYGNEEPAGAVRAINDIITETVQNRKAIIHNCRKTESTESLQSAVREGRFAPGRG